MSDSAATGSWVSDTYGITMADSGSPVGLTMSDLVVMALRQNPRRAQLLVSTVLGKHIPVDPRIVAGSGRLLGALVAQALADERGPASWSAAARAAVSGADPGALLEVLPTVSPEAAAGSADLLTIGFAETATSLGHLVADQLGTGYMHSTRRRSGDVAVAAEFSEPHSHATGHLLRPADPDLLTTAGTVVLVDDELSTGTTALNVIEVLHGITPRARYVLAGLVDVRSPADDDRRAAVAERLGCRIDVVSLVRGSVEVPPDAVERIAADLTRPDLIAAGSDRGAAAPGSVSQLELPWPNAVPTGGRHGFLPADRPGFDAAIAAAVAALEEVVGPAGRVLVIGTEELMYLPLRIAAGLSSPDRQTAFQSTTRSPVHAVDRPGYPVRRRIDFRSAIDGGARTAERHLYNAWWPAGGEADLVLLVDDRPSRPGPTGPAAAIAVATGAPVVSVALPQSGGA